MIRIRAALALLALLAFLSPAQAQYYSPRAGGGATVVTTGGTPVVALTGPANGCYIKNPDNAAGPLFVDPTGIAATLTESVTNGALAAGRQWTCPPAVGVNATISVNAADNAHAFVVVRW